ncbi:MAG: putative beta-barrel porin-2, OmpL-like, partial [Armatimonadota bacterium]
MRNLTISFVALVGLAALSSTANAQEVKIGGSLGINFSNNFNKPAGGNTFLYNSKDAQFSLNLAELTVSREATARNRGGFHLRFIDGDVRNALLMPGAFVAEAYGTQLIEAGNKDIRLDVGQYRTLVGSEGLGIDNFISRSFAF